MRQQTDGAAVHAALAPGRGLRALRAAAAAVARPGDGLHLRPVRVRELRRLGSRQVTRSTIYNSAVGSAVENCFIAPCCIYFSSASKCQFYNLICQTFF